MEKKKSGIRENVPHWFCQNHDLLDKLLRGKNAGGILQTVIPFNSRDKNMQTLKKSTSHITTEQMLLESYYLRNMSYPASIFLQQLLEGKR